MRGTVVPRGTAVTGRLCQADGMASPPVRVPRWPAAAPEGPDFAAIRAEFDVPEDFPADVLAEAERRAAALPLPELDATDVPLVTLDPPGSRDLDQAVHLAARPGGYRVSYAIADVGAFVPLGSAIDGEARRRGQTLYCPDGRTPLHPPQLSEGAATAVDLHRARVRSRAQLDYESAGGQVPPELELLPEIGRLLQTRARDRG